MPPTRKGSPPPSRGPGRPVGTDSGRTREHLLRVARSVLTEEGFPRTTIREIAERANVNPALLHYYFGNKTGLHAAVIEQVGKQIQASLEMSRGATASTEQRLRELVRAYVVVLGSEPWVAQMLIHHLLLADADPAHALVSRVARPLLDGMVELLREGVSGGEFREMDLSFLASSIAASCLGFVVADPLLGGSGQGHRPSPAAIEAWAESVADLVLNGIARR